MLNYQRVDHVFFWNHKYSNTAQIFIRKYSHRLFSCMVFCCFQVNYYICCSPNEQVRVVSSGFLQSPRLIKYPIRWKYWTSTEATVLEMSRPNYARVMLKWYMWLPIALSQRRMNKNIPNPLVNDHFPLMTLAPDKSISHFWWYTVLYHGWWWLIMVFFLPQIPKFFGCILIFWNSIQPQFVFVKSH